MTKFVNALQKSLAIVLIMALAPACGQSKEPERASLNQLGQGASSQAPQPQPLSTQPLTFDDVTFPQGELSFADQVIRLDYNRAGDQVSGVNRDGSRALGAPDDSSMSLGNAENESASSDFIVEFTDNRLVDVEGDDLYIFEIGPAVEATSVEISENGSQWFPLGRIEGSTRSIDLANYPQLPSRGEYRFVRLRDFPDGNTSGSPHAGPDIDAVGAIGSIAASPGPAITPQNTPPQRSQPQRSGNSSSNPSQSCSLENSEFQAIGNDQYTLVFDPANEFASVPYTVTLAHAQRGPVELFDYQVSVGYPSTTFSLQKDRGTSEPRGFSVYFFDGQKQPAYDPASATYMVISGLGSYDYYNNVETGSRTHELGDVMWQRSCR